MPIEQDTMEALEAADQRRKMTEPEHVERIREYAEWPYTTRDTIVLDSDLVRITAGDLADLLAERDALSAALQEGPNVKPLEWMEGGFEQDADLVDTTETYQIQEGIFWYGCQVDGTRCEDNEAAKAAAQAHHDARVRAMLADRGE